jgi:transcription elongation GreA/GreB family factor
MKDKQVLKQNIFNRIHNLLAKAEAETLQLIKQTKESRDNENKSSAGDKHETSRALTQHELEKYEQQLGKVHQQQNELVQLNIQNPSNNVTIGSLVFTDKQCFFICLGLGKVTVDTQEVYAISLASPIGKLLKAKNVNDAFQFQGKHYKILEIV